MIDREVRSVYWHLTFMSRDKLIGYACLCTIILEALSLWLAGLAGVDYRVLGISLTLGWLPILIVAIRRPKSPTPFDIIMMFGGFPAVLVSLAALTRWLM